ncbi:MAG: helix-turn-helix domain-containing protein [Thermodesulfobacteriota bacterium]
MKVNLEILNTKEVEERIAKEVVKALEPLLAKGKGDTDVLFTVTSLAEYLGVSKQWVYDRIKFKEIPYIKVGKFPRFRKRDIDRWLDSLKVPAVNPCSGKLKRLK